MKQMNNDNNNDSNTFITNARAWARNSKGESNLSRTLRFMIEHAVGRENAMPIIGVIVGAGLEIDLDTFWESILTNDHAEDISPLIALGAIDDEVFLISNKEDCEYALASSKEHFLTMERENDTSTS